MKKVRSDRRYTLTARFSSDGGGSLDSVTPVEQRTIFVSHSHADRSLASQLQALVETVFSGVVKVFASSDRGPTGGIMPGGDEWYSQIEAGLRKAEAVWVLATPASITRPWIYWEAGTGRAVCPRGLVILRAGLNSTQIPSPLNNFQTYDGLVAESVGELLNKVAHQIGMTLAPVLVDSSVKSWVEAAANHQPEQSDDEGAPNLTPERLDRLEAIISRLEAMAVIGPYRGSLRDFVRAYPTADNDIEARHDEPEGTYRAMSFDSLVELVERLPNDAQLGPVSVNADGETTISGVHKGGRFAITLPLEVVAGRSVSESASVRTRRLIRSLANTEKHRRGLAS
ncbi:MAG: toll/interleukin-1 receptor domain-containing protein [Dehalococcoidia bacterium]|nr:toll/interleukin-1 receptor domain-containing protein [Dehalococcoidia bacterium]